MAKTLLLADDSVTIQKVVNISFASEDVTLVTVDNGDDAVERAKETRPDLVLADVVMPGKSGYEVCEAIKADPELRHIPVLLLTGTFEAFDEARAARVGAAGHVAKPFEAQTLVARVKELLAAAPPPPPPSAEPVIATAAASPNHDSFDFFDDDLSAAAPAMDEVAIAEPLGSAASDFAFSFGDSELTPMDAPAPEPMVASTPIAPASDSSFPDRTVAILPDDPSAPDHGIDPPRAAEPVEIPPTALSADLVDGGFGNPEDELLAIGESDDDDFFVTADATAGADEPFDFSFDRDPVTDELAGETGPLSVEARDVAQATVLDPNGASGYDVSSSDLGDPFAPGAADESIALASLEMESPRPSHAVIDERLDVDEPAEATAFLDLATLDDDMPDDDGPIASAELVDEPVSHRAMPDPFDELEDPIVPDPIFDAAPAPIEEARPLPAASAAAADSVLAEITPQLREQLHDSLEKIAWESFGEMTEKIVGEVVDRIEKIAWEVIPQLTETLIKAEIRRMKGDSES